MSEAPELYTMEEGAIAEAFLKPTLKEKLSKVAAHCAYVRKDGVNLFHKYNYATAATIFEKVNEALIEHRLVSSPRFTIAESKDRTNAKGTVENLVTVTCELCVQDIDSEAKVLTIALGSGQDNGDKAVMKAQTAALKYAWMMLLNISTGDDPEDDAKVDSRMSGEPITKKKTPDEYAATVEANKRADYSPEAIRLSDEINASLKAQGVKPLWPDEKPKEDRCPCGAPLIQKVNGKAKGSKPYTTCSLSFKATVEKDFESQARVEEMAQEGICGVKEHHFEWVK